MDSTGTWEDEAGPPAPPPPPPPRFSFNPNASTFAFSPGATSFTPSFAAPPPPPPAAYGQPPGFGHQPQHQQFYAPPQPVPPPPPPSASLAAAAAPQLQNGAIPHAPAPQQTQAAAAPAPQQPPPPAAAEPERRSMEVDDAEQASGSAAPPAAASPALEVAAPDAVAEKLSEVKLNIVDEPVTPVDDASILKAYEQLMAEDPRDHLNIVFIGHIDAGKSTLAGQILFLTGGVDKRTIEKYEREAKEKNREGWYMAYIMDTNEEERVKGITVEVGRAHFETEKKRYTILDAPGHKNYVPNMIQGACQADTAILLISARKGEFETGFERGGQTREHAQLAKTLGVSRLIVVINKLDCPSVCLPDGKWDKGRFDAIVNGLTPFLRSCGYNMKKEVSFLPLAALYGHNVKDQVPKSMCDWWDGPSLFEALDAIEHIDRNPLAPVRLPIVDRWKEMGTIIMGKIESGFMRVGDVFQLMPNKLKVKVEAIWRDEKEVQMSQSGENLRIRVTGAEETDVSAGFVLSSIKSPVPCVTQFEAQLMIVELLEHNPVFTVGYKSILHIHTACEECEITKLICEVDPKTKDQKKVKFVKLGGVCICRISVDKAICIETFQDLAALGRFTLRDEGRTIAIGKVTKLPKVH